MFHMQLDDPDIHWIAEKNRMVAEYKRWVYPNKMLQESYILMNHSGENREKLVKCKFLI